MSAPQYFWPEIAATANAIEAHGRAKILEIARADTCPDCGGHRRDNLDCRFFQDECADCGAIWPDLCRPDCDLPTTTRELYHQLERCAELGIAEEEWRTAIHLPVEAVAVIRQRYGR
jgi:hypothetical protein